MTVSKLPHISECQVTGGFDTTKGKTWITLAYEGIKITEWWPSDSQREGLTDAEVMDKLALICRQRLCLSLAARERKAKVKEEEALRRVYLVKQ